MKKLLLLAALALTAGSMSAAEYTVFSKDISGSLTWTGGNDGYTADVTVSGIKFTLSLEKGSSTTNCVEPTDLIKVYKKAKFTVKAEGLTMKTVSFTGTNNYAAEQTVSEGWTLAANGLVSTMTNADGASSLEFTADNSQFRVANIVVSDEVQSAPEPPASTAVNSIAETISLADGTPVKVDYDLTVAFVNKNNIFCQDAAGDFIQIYGSNSYAANDVIPAGWEASYKLFNGVTPELEPVSLPKAEGQKEFVAKNVGAADINVGLVNSVVTIPGVEFAAATPAAKENFTGTADGVELSFRNNYTIESVPAGRYDVTVVVTIFQNAPSLYVINFAQSSGVEGIEAAEGAAEYYNLQGVKVANPGQGVYVRVLNGKAAKVMLRK